MTRGGGFRDERVQGSDDAFDFPLHNPNPVLRIGAEGQVRFLNDGARTFLTDLGWSPDEKCPRNLWRLVTAAKDRNQSTRETLEAGVELFLLDIVPSTRIAEIYIYGTNITALRREQEARVALESAVQSAQKMESLALLAGGIAHDFNNLLMGILGNVSLVQTNFHEEAPVQEVLGEIETAAVRAAELARQMLAYSGRGSFEIRAVNLNHLIKEMAELLRASIAKTVKFTMRLNPVLPAVLVDVTQIRQVIMNLVTNAAEAISGDSGTVVISTDRTFGPRDATGSSPAAAPASFVTMTVRDDGSGMDQETQSKIFEPYFSTKFTGRGLGLAAVLGIIRGHKGTISVESRVGEGTTFRVCLPAEENPFVRRMSAETRAWSFRGEGTVLLVDDEQVIRSTATRLLEQLGFDVLIAKDGREGLDVFDANRDAIVLAIVDMVMPRMGGDATLRELRTRSRELPVLLSSGYTETEIMARYTGRRLDGFIQKPYTLSTLQSAIAKVLDPA